MLNCVKWNMLNFAKVVNWLALVGLNGALVLKNPNDWTEPSLIISGVIIANLVGLSGGKGRVNAALVLNWVNMLLTVWAGLDTGDFFFGWLAFTIFNLVALYRRKRTFKAKPFPWKNRLF